MIDVHELVKTYDGKRVLDELSFHVTSGQVTAFLGPNGAGKSTTLRMIMGVGKPGSCGADRRGAARKLLVGNWRVAA
ncbi:ATP-binding cassette domain-containing protein [Streptomyces sp. NBC_01410]|uniref:ATP-binding cassette domain-containing protein n=1 Tax=Streptomyces sp. NBC_01410 TaxID=2903856 RepID=UPI00386BEE6C